MMWVASGGFEQGFVYGQTDELGYNVAEDPVNVHDLHAAILQQMGIKAYMPISGAGLPFD